MALAITVKMGHKFRVGTAEIQLVNITQNGKVTVSIQAPEDVQIHRKVERDVIYQALKLLRDFDNEESIDKATDLLANFVKNNYLDENTNR